MPVIFRKSVAMCMVLAVGLVAGCPEAATLPEGLDATALDSSANAGSQPPAAAAPAGPAAATPGSPAATVPTGLARPAAPLLFLIADVSHIAVEDDGVFAFANAAGLDGDYLRNEVQPTNYISGINGLARWFPSALEITVDRKGALVALVEDGMLVFNNAQTATGNLTPDRELDASSSPFWLFPEAMVMDRERDRIFVSSGDAILVFDAFSTIPSGRVAPTRVIESADFNGRTPRSLALAANGDLYAAMGQSVVVFADAGSRGGRVPADRIIQLEEAPGELARHSVVFVDGADRLYVVDVNDIVLSAGTIYVLDRATDRKGTLAPDRRINLEKSADFSLISPRSILVDSAGVGYVGDFENAAVHIIEKIGTRDGTVTPERSISRIADAGMFLWE